MASYVKVYDEPTADLQANNLTAGCMPLMIIHLPALQLQLGNGILVIEGQVIFKTQITTMKLMDCFLCHFQLWMQMVAKVLRLNLI